MNKARLSRRALLKGAAAGALLVGAGAGLGGCNTYYSPESGPAFAPWDYPPAGETRPEWLAAYAAVLAASPHNTQPWLFAIAPLRIDVYADLERHLGTMDVWRRELHIGLGCAVENLAIAAARHGRAPTVRLLPTPGDERHVAAVDLAEASPVPSPLFDAIPRRHTNRHPYLEAPPPPGLEAAMRALVTEPEVGLRWLAQPEEKQRFRAATVAATLAIVDDDEMIADSDAWFRHTEAEIARFRDGPTLDAAGLSTATRDVGKVFARQDAKTAGGYWLEATRTRQLGGWAFVILTTPADAGRVAELAVGRVYQRLHLWATARGLAMQPINQLAERRDREERAGLPQVAGAALAELLGDGARAQMLFRVGIPWEEALKSPRRPLDWVVRA